MKSIKVLGSCCSKCKTTYNNVLEALKQTGIEANVEERTGFALRQAVCRYAD